MLQVRENEMSLRDRSAGSAQLRALEGAWHTSFKSSNDSQQLRTAGC